MNSILNTICYELWMMPVANFFWNIWHFKKAFWVWLCVCVGGGRGVCEEEVGVCVCEGTVNYVVDIILYILEEVCEEEVCVCVKKGLYIMYWILFCTYYVWQITSLSMFYI